VTAVVDTQVCPRCGGPTKAVSVGLAKARPWCADYTGCGWGDGKTTRPAPPSRPRTSIRRPRINFPQLRNPAPPTPPKPKRWVPQPEYIDAQSLEIGLYELPDGAVYLVRLNEAGTHVYAQRLVVAASNRIMADGSTKAIDYEYERGSITRIRPEHRMSKERADELSIVFGRCVICGKKLKVKESVEAGIGPKCRKNYRLF